jgi:long-chain fatty acid transport protein
VPAGYFTRQLGARAAVGIGMFAPYGLTSEWPSTFQGRFMAYKTQLQALYFQPTFAYQVANGFQVGVGVDYVAASAKVHRRVDASTLPAPSPAPAGTYLANLGVPVGTDFADGLFDVTGSGWGGQIGLMWQASSKLSFGIRYMTQVKVNFTGKATFTAVPTGITLAAGNPFGAPGGTPLDAVLASAFTTSLANQNASTTITMPAQLVVGLAYAVTPQLKVMADYQYTDWTVFKSLDLKLDAANLVISEYEHYIASNAFRAGVEWQATNGLALRAGMLTHKGAAPDETVTPILPEGQRIEGTVGAGINLTSMLRLDVAYQYIYQGDRRGRMIDVAAPTPANNHGIFAFTANLFGASLALAF